MRSCGRNLILAGLLALLAVGCRVDATTTVTMAEDGSGTVVVEVVLDGGAADRLDELGDQLRVDDLEAAGWDVTGPDPTDDGGRRVTAAKPFADPDQATAILSEVTGPSGVLNDVAVRRSKSFARLDQSVAATLDLSGGIEAFGDDDLTELLGGLAIGQDVAALEEELGAPLDELTSFTVVVDLPDGRVSSEGDPQVTGADGRQVFRWEATLGEGPTDLRAETEDLNWPALGLAVLAAVCGLTLAIILLRRITAHRGATAVAEPEEAGARSDDAEPEPPA